MPKLFGTDGVRGVANLDLTPELVYSLGRAAADAIMGGVGKLVVGRDTRISGRSLESALVAGAVSGGAEPISIGVIPTPAVAYLTTHLGASLGAVISASHNPYQDNGIKFFGPEGYKLSEDQESSIEAAMTDGNGESAESLTPLAGAEELYVSHCLGCLEGVRLEGLRVVLDCAHGASFRTSPRALEEAGADLLVINAEPDGLNINLESGSTHPEAVAAAVLEHRADVGLAHDGDADRLIAVDERGQVVDGDTIIAALAIDMKHEGRLKGDLVVSTVMANLGFRRAMQSAGIELIETDVGDRYVVEAMIARGAVLGGEQSGHVILTEHATTGDGLITALRLLRLLADGQKLSEVASVVEKHPQVIRNVKVKNKSTLGASKEVASAVKASKARLGEDGRVLIRASGTEPIVRVMVEAADAEVAEAEAAQLGELISKLI